MALLAPLAAVACATRAAPSPTPASTGSTAQGCYRFDRPLGASATGEREQADSSWYSVQLRDGGAVARPLLASAGERRIWERRSTWRTSGDTLYMRVFTGLVGWDVALTPQGDDLVGSAEYLSDASVGGAARQRYVVRASRPACPVAPPA